MSYSAFRTAVSRGAAIASLPSSVPPAVLIFFALRYISPPSRGNPFFGSPKTFTSMPRCRSSPSNATIYRPGVVVLLIVDGSFVLNALTVAAILPM